MHAIQIPNAAGANLVQDGGRWNENKLSLAFVIE